jgi:hypothetical protein
MTKLLNLWHCTYRNSICHMTVYTIHAFHVGIIYNGNLGFYSDGVDFLVLSCWFMHMCT